MSKQTVALPSTMRINGLSEVKDMLTPFVASSDDLELDGSAVDSFDTSGLQLLIAAQKTLMAEGRKLTVVNPSDAITQAVQISEAHAYLSLAE